MLVSVKQALSNSGQVYKQVPVNYYKGQPCNGQASHPRGSRNSPCRFMLQKLWLPLAIVYKCAT